MVLENHIFLQSLTKFLRKLIGILNSLNVFNSYEVVFDRSGDLLCFPHTL